MDSRSPKELFEAHFPLIREILEKLCRLRRLPPDEDDDFISYATLRLIQNDYAILRRFGGKSSLKTYLVTVSSRMLLDYRNQRWGKWRPSAQARRLGKTAELLETFIVRDGLSREEAIAKLVEREEGLDRAELFVLEERLPARARRRFESAEQLQNLASGDRADGRILARERSRTGRQVRAAFHHALAGLTAEERRLLDRHYREGVTIRQIATELGLESRLLYRQIERCLRRLRAAVESRNLSREVVLEAVGWG